MSERDTVQRFRFGIFEVDAETGELRRQGVLVKLNSQPFQMLLLLLERPGELITREEIASRLWPQGTFVDFDHGVNAAVNRIREALGDIASSPRFIETLPRRGYRFSAPVEKIGAAPAIDVQPAQFIAVEAEEQSAVEANWTLLATRQELPKVPEPVATVLYALLQVMYLAFYVGALMNLPEIEQLLSALPHGPMIYLALLITATVLIPVRAFTLCAALFRPPNAPAKLMRLWSSLLVLDELWSLAPFLLLHHIDFGMALACTALLVYSPFAQRSLVLMGAGAISTASGESAKSAN